jgi:hypothetical protein
MSGAFYYVTLSNDQGTFELMSSVSYEEAKRYAIDLNLATGDKPTVFYYSTLEISDFEVYPLNERYLR